MNSTAIPSKFDYLLVNWQCGECLKIWPFRPQADSCCSPYEETKRTYFALKACGGIPTGELEEMDVLQIIAACEEARLFLNKLNFFTLASYELPEKSEYESLLARLNKVLSTVKLKNNS